MFDDHPILLAALTGFGGGMLLSIPVGPVNLTIMNAGARNGLHNALMISLGAILMETIYCFLAFTGFASFFSRGLVKASMELFSFVFMLFLGVKFVIASKVTEPTHLTDATDRIEEEIEHRLHPTSAFATGFVRVMANPGVLLFWIVFAAHFISREWVPASWPGKIACVAGVTSGVGLWFLGISYISSKGKERLSDKTLLRMEHISGIVLLVLAFAHGCNIVWQMAHHKI